MISRWHFVGIDLGREAAPYKTLAPRLVSAGEA